MVAAAVLLLVVVAEREVVLVAAAVATNGNGSPGVDESGIEAVSLVLMVEPLATLLVGEGSRGGERTDGRTGGRTDGGGKGRQTSRPTPRRQRKPWWFNQWRCSACRESAYTSECTYQAYDHPGIIPIN